MFDSEYYNSTCLQPTAPVGKAVRTDAARSTTCGFSSTSHQVGDMIPWVLRPIPSSGSLANSSSGKLQGCVSLKLGERAQPMLPVPLSKTKAPKLVAPKHTIVSPAAFRLSTKGVEVYVLEISDLHDDGGTKKMTKEQIPVKYQDLWEAFSEEASNKLPSHGVLDMKIEFKEGKELCNTGLQPMSPMELEELRQYLEENLDKGWIQRSKSPVSAPIVFAQKKNGSI